MSQIRSVSVVFLKKKNYILNYEFFGFNKSCNFKSNKLNFHIAKFNKLNHKPILKYLDFYLLFFKTLECNLLIFFIFL